MFQPLEFLKRNWVSIVLILIILFLVHTLFQSNAAEQSAREDAKQSKAMVAKLVAEMKSKDEKHNAIMAAMDEDIKRYDSIVIDLQTALNESKKDVRWYFSRIKVLTKQADSLRTSVDTTEYSRKMDSAAREIDNAALAYAQMEYRVLELEKALAQREGVKDDQIAALKEQLESTRKSFLEMVDRYNKLYKDFAEVAKKSKRRLLLNRILAGSVLATGGALLLK